MIVSSWSGTWPHPCKIKMCYVNKDTKSRSPTPPPCQIKFSMKDPLWLDNLLITVFWFSRCIYFFKDIDDCLPNPCINGGECTNTMGSFTCQCESGLTGKFCEQGKLLWMQVNHSVVKFNHFVNSNRG